MDPHLLFSIVNKAVLPAWLLLIVAPHWRYTNKIIHHAWIPMLLAVCYIYSLASITNSSEGGGFGTLSGVMILFQSPYGVLAGWIHYLVFDLFIGAWEVRDAKRNNIKHYFVVPCLILTLMLGPIGLMLYLTIRYFKTKKFNLIEN